MPHAPVRTRTRPAHLLRRVGSRVLSNVEASPRARRFLLVGIGLATLLVVLAVAVGVIALDNVVISRTAELGRLDTQRRQLRTGNALDSAKVAQLSAPPRIIRIAKHKLGMEDSPFAPQFIWLHPTRAQRAEDHHLALAGRVASLESLVADPSITTTQPASKHKAKAGAATAKTTSAGASGE